MLLILNLPPPATIGVAGSPSIVGSWQLKSDTTPLEQNHIPWHRSISDVRDRLRHGTESVSTDMNGFSCQPVSVTDPIREHRQRRPKNQCQYH